MKRGTTPTLIVTFAVDNEDVTSVDFIFKQEDRDDAPVLVAKKYPEGVEFADGKYNVLFTAEETFLFKENAPFYMDTRLVTKSGSIPETPIVQLFMNKTLFKSEAVAE